MPDRTNRAWNDYVLDLLEEAITASGGTVPDLTLYVAWNDKVLALLEALAAAGGGTSLEAIVAESTDGTWTLDTGAIGGTAGAGTSTGIKFVPTTPGTISGDPVNMLKVHGPLSRDITGSTEAVLDAFAQFLMMMFVLSIITSSFTDMHVIWVAYDGSVSSTPTAGTEGWGCGMLYTSGEWQTTIWRNSGAGWASTGAPGGGTNPDTEGVRAEIMPAQAAIGTRMAAFGVDLGGSPTSGTNEATGDVLANMGETPMTRLACGVGWETGIGGSGGTEIEVYAAASALDALLGVEGVLS